MTYETIMKTTKTILNDRGSKRITLTDELNKISVLIKEVSVEVIEENKERKIIISGVKK